jgi:hypothetical protein
MFIAPRDKHDTCRVGYGRFNEGAHFEMNSPAFAARFRIANKKGLQPTMTVDRRP